jgi:TatD DNase family protein
MLMPLDMHAHIEPGIAPSELDRLGACVVAMTRSLGEYKDVARRQDGSVVWGIGCHPGLAKAVRGFSLSSFRAALTSAAVVGEVGLDGSARVPLADQQAVFDEVISALVETPRIVSVHSYRATSYVLDTVERLRPKGVVLHWWLGTEEETRRAVAVGAYFSLNASQVSKWTGLAVVPRDRLLTETDHPFGDRREASPHRPGNIGHVERRLGESLGLAPDEVRRLAWRNLSRLATEVGVHDLLPHQFQVQMLAS